MKYLQKFNEHLLDLFYKLFVEVKVLANLNLGELRVAVLRCGCYQET